MGNFTLMGMLLFIETRPIRQEKYVKVRTLPQYYAPFDFSFSFRYFSTIFSRFTFSLQARREEGELRFRRVSVFCKTCIILIDVRQKLYSRLFLSLLLLLFFFFIIKRETMARSRDFEQGNKGTVCSEDYVS